MRIRSLVLLVSLTLATTVARTQTIGLYNRLLDPLALARLDEPDFVRTRQVYGLGLGLRQSETDPGYWVCAEDTGAGIITHLFSTARTPDSLTSYRLYIDGALVRDAGINGFFKQPHGALRPPLDTIIGEARLCDVQMPYTKGFKLLYSSPDGRVFYNYGWRPVESASVLPTSGNLFSSELLTEQSRAEAIYRHPEQFWQGYGGAQSDYSFTLPAGATHTAINLTGPAVVREIRIAVDTYSVSLDSIVVEFFYDGQTRPAFSAPLMALFGQSYDFRSLYSLPIVFTKDSGLVLRFPIPFIRSLRIAFTNRGSQSAPIRGSVVWFDYPVTRSTFGYLHAHFSETPLTTWGVPHPVMRARGRGRYVGMLMGIPDLHAGAAYEGDPIFTVDSSARYSFHYDGMEDYFNGAQYFSFGEFFTPFGGTSNRFASYYRFHYLDAINFFTSLDLVFQHGVNNNCWEHYRTLAFWYERPYRFWTERDTIIEGTTLRISGSAYSPNESLTIEAANESDPTAFRTLATISSDAEGAFDASVSVAGLSPGFYVLRIGDEVSPYPLCIHAGPTLQLLTAPKPIRLQTNDTLRIAGWGYDRSTGYSASIGGEAAAFTYAVDSATRITGSAVIPHVPDGTYRLILRTPGRFIVSDEPLALTRKLRFEAEALLDSAQIEPQQCYAVNVSWLYNWEWSHNGVVEFRARGVADSLVLPFYLPFRDSFLVYARGANGRRYANYDLWLDDSMSDRGGSAPVVRLTGFKDVDQVVSDSLLLYHGLLEQGIHQLHCVYRGKSSANIDSMLWLDFLECVPIGPPPSSVVDSSRTTPRIRIAQNPVHTSTLDVLFDTDSINGRWRIVDVAGRTLASGNIATVEQHPLPIDIRSLSNGLYFLQVDGFSTPFVLER